MDLAVFAKVYSLAQHGQCVAQQLRVKPGLQFNRDLVINHQLEPDGFRRNSLRLNLAPAIGRSSLDLFFGSQVTLSSVKGLIVDRVLLAPLSDA